jgi:radical SAM family protein/B12 binding protein
VEFCLVSPPTVTEFRRELSDVDAVRRLAEHAPVGVLTLAAVLRSRGCVPGFVDMNCLYRDYLTSDAVEDSKLDFCAYAVDHLLTGSFDVFGFGTICSSYPLTLRIAERLRSQRPDAKIILGGPQASVVDVATMQQFSSVDYVVRFEAEESLPTLLDVLEAGGDITSVRGLTYRSNGSVFRNPNAEVFRNLDDLPLPAFHLYPYVGNASLIPLELGRGCPYGCTFCSTNDFFRKQFRLKSPKLIVQQMRTLTGEYGIARFDLIHDMFTVNRGLVVEFCEELLRSGEAFRWNCSARTDRVDDELLELMAEAGCAGIFFGIETGSEKLQGTVKKRLVLSDAKARIGRASELGMRTTVSLITCFPDEREEDFASTVGFFVDALRFENTVPQLHILAPLADTPLHREFHDRLSFDDIVSDMSHQGWDQFQPDRDLIASHPDVFPNFYAIPTPLDRRYVKAVRSFLLFGSAMFRSLLVALHQQRGHILGVFDDFERWRPERGEGAATDSAEYFRSDGFRRDFLDYVRECQVDDSPCGQAVATLVTYAQTFDADAARDLIDLAEDGLDDSSPEGSTQRRAFAPTSVPDLAEAVRLVEVGVDYQTLMDRLIKMEGLADLRLESRTLASRRVHGHRPEVVQLSPLSAELIKLCDGKRTVDEIGRKVASLDVGLDGIPVDQYVLVGLEMLRGDGLIRETATAG